MNGKRGCAELIGSSISRLIHKTFHWKFKLSKYCRSDDKNKNASYLDLLAIIFIIDKDSEINLFWKIKKL